MSLRSFTVFQDTPSSETPPPKATTSTVLATLSSSSNAMAAGNATLPSLASTSEKENVHPVTGERAGPISNIGKKRKTSVLATKVHISSGSKQQKESKEVQPETKKRKSSSSSVPKNKSSSKKEGKSSGLSTRKTTSKRTTRRVSPMPTVAEVTEAEKEKERMTQADIDSKCYELTVQPLADVSQAYDESCVLDQRSATDKVKFRTVKASSAEPELRDYFVSPSSCSSLPSGSTVASCPSGPLQDGRAFSTPERKQIYAAFTFCSPSPTSERYSKVTRAASVPRLQLVATDLTPA